MTEPQDSNILNGIDYTDPGKLKEPKIEPTIEQQLPPEMQNTIEKFVSNPLFSIAAKSHIPEIQKYISNNAGDYEEVVYEYLKLKHPSIYNLLQPDEESAGQENEGNFQGNGQGTQENEPNEEFEPLDEISDEVMIEAIKYMVFCRNKGFTYALIREKLQNKYNIDLTPTVIQKYVTNYEEEIETTEKEINDIQEIPDRNAEGLKKIQAMYAELTQLRAKVAEYEREKAIREAVDKITNPTQTYIMPVKQQETQHRGLIRTALHYLY